MSGAWAKCRPAGSTIAYNIVKSIPTLCTPSELLFLIKRFEGRVTAHLFWALTGTVNIMKIIYYRCSNRHGM